MKHLFAMERPISGEPPANSLINEATPFQPLPKPIGPAPFHLDIKTIITPAVYNGIISSQKMVFHVTGDVGGVKHPADQQLVADHMETQFNEPDQTNNPAFFYLLGDVVYYYGKTAEYNSQFYEPYKFYKAPIFAIAGNHDGDIDPTDALKPKSLDAFVKFFCSKKAQVPAEAGDAIRTTMVQPNVYWTLVTPVANIIGLYSNVPEGGEIQPEQQAWLVSELIAANKERNKKALLVTLHHPPYSMDAHHGASRKMQQVLEDAINKSKVVPDIVLSGHIHNYQRFTKQAGNRQVPYIVAGAGGYWFLHNMSLSGTGAIKTPAASPFKDVVLEKYCENRHGFLRMEIDMQKKQLTAKYFTVPRVQEAWRMPPKLFDSFTLDLTKNKLS